jgi:hypothetical protein
MHGMCVVNVKVKVKETLEGVELWKPPHSAVSDPLEFKMVKVALLVAEKPSVAKVSR